MAAAFMASRARLPIDPFLLISFLLIIGCVSELPETSLSIPAEWVSRRDSGWVVSQGILFLNGSPYTGWQYETDAKGDTLFLGGFLEGWRQGRHVSKYASGQLSEVRHFVDGRQEGMGQQWHPNGQIVFEANFVEDHYEGQVRTWYENGQPHEQFHYQSGKEEGRQQRWDEQGNVLANYEVRNGRKYGLSGKKNCASPWDVDSLDLRLQ